MLVVQRLQEECRCPEAPPSNWEVQAVVSKRGKKIAFGWRWPTFVSRRPVRRRRSRRRKRKK